MCTLENAPVAILLRHDDDDYTLWQPEIPADDPLWLELLKKYQNSGSTIRGNKQELCVEALETFNASIVTACGQNGGTI